MQHESREALPVSPKIIQGRLRKVVVMNIVYDLTGQKFGRLTALEFIRCGEKHIGLWKCKCDCGNERFVRSNSLRTGRTQSCGCMQHEIVAKNQTTHGGSKDRLYWVWSNMLRRCEKKYSDYFPDYGGRGIKVCNEWHDYSVFKKWMIENGYDSKAKTGKTTIDRIDVNGDYCPENCRVVPMSVQNINKRNNHLLTYDGHTKPLSVWANEMGIKKGTLLSRIKYGWSVEDALTIKPKFR